MLLGHHGRRRRSADRREGGRVDQHLDATTDMAAQQLVDLVRYINGELSTGQITNGTYIQNWAVGGQAQRRRWAADAVARRGRQAPRRPSGLDEHVTEFDALTATAPPARDPARCCRPARRRSLDVDARNDIASPGRRRQLAVDAWPGARQRPRDPAHQPGDARSWRRLPPNVSPAGAVGRPASRRWRSTTRWCARA